MSKLNTNSVALRKESVDRNQHGDEPAAIGEKSLSARRAWIEIAWQAPRPSCLASLSARRAWIEMEITGTDAVQAVVALRKESVDRNIVGRAVYHAVHSRSPQGERG